MTLRWLTGWDVYILSTMLYPSIDVHVYLLLTEKYKWVGGGSGGTVGLLTMNMQHNNEQVHIKYYLVAIFHQFTIYICIAILTILAFILTSILFQFFYCILNNNQPIYKFNKNHYFHTSISLNFHIIVTYI